MYRHHCYKGDIAVLSLLHTKSRVGLSMKPGTFRALHLAGLKKLIIILLLLTTCGPLIKNYSRKREPPKTAVHSGVGVVNNPGPATTSTLPFRIILLSETNSVYAPPSNPPLPQAAIPSTHHKRFPWASSLHTLGHHSLNSSTNIKHRHIDNNVTKWTTKAPLGPSADSRIRSITTMSTDQEASDKKLQHSTLSGYDGK